jgi:hypothetical protein
MTASGRFLDAGNKDAPQAQLTGVQKAPRHEVAGSVAPGRATSAGTFKQTGWRFRQGNFCYCVISAADVAGRVWVLARA